jgi:hypothetical protein
MGNLEIKSPLGRRERRWEDNIKMYPWEIEWDCRLDSFGWG